MRSQDPDLDSALARHLLSRKTQILEAWHERALEKPVARAAPSLSKREFYDDIPDLLDQLAAALEKGEEQIPMMAAGAHGYRRWQQGFQLTDMVEGYRTLHALLLDEVVLFQKQLDPPAALTPLSTLLSKIMVGVIEADVRSFLAMREKEAETRVLELERAFEAKVNHHCLMYGGSHDLKGSLSALHGLDYLLRQQLPSPTPDLAELLDLLTASVEQVSAMTEELLELARLDAGKEAYCPRSVDLDATLKPAILKLVGLARKKGLTLSVEAEEGLVVLTDPVKLERIVQNLTLNAITYTTEGSVTVSWRAYDAHRWRLVVEDTGPGVPWEETRSLREGFGERSEAVSLGTGGGEGIGLAIVRGLCGLLGGSIILDSEIDRGSRFTLTFPR